MNIVFAAGYLVPQHLANEAYFRGVAAAFPFALFPSVPVFGEIPVRAAALAAQIGVAFPTGPIHIVAHSMAGLDARYLLSKNLAGLGMPGRVASLSTIATPHKGTPVADFLVGPEPSFLDPRWVTYQTLVHLGDELGRSLGASCEMTRDYAANFNVQNPNLPHVKYFCYAGSGMESFLLKPSSFFIQVEGQNAEERANDGLVSVESAAWVPLAEEPWPTDHIGEIGYSLSSPILHARFDHIAAYERALARAGAGV